MPGTPDGRAEIGRQRRAKTRAAIIAAAFEKFGDENGLYATIEEVVDAAGVTRATFYNHFAGMVELREALAHEVTHDFLNAVNEALSSLPDARQRSAAAVRLYLRRARRDKRWGWSMINMSASGYIFGRETYIQAEKTIREGMDEGVLPLHLSELGRDLLLGTALAAMGSIVRSDMPEDYPEAVAGFILCGMGVELMEAYRFAHLPLPEITIAELLAP